MNIKEIKIINIIKQVINTITVMQKYCPYNINV